MTKIDQIKILDSKIRANKAQYDLDRKNAVISPKSSGELDKYEYLTGEDLGYRPDVVSKAKFEYSPLGEVFTKGLEENDKDERLLKRLKNIEGKNKDQLDEIEYQGQNQLDAIKEQEKKNLISIKKQGKQLKEIKNQKKQMIEKINREGKSKDIILLRDNLDNILLDYEFNIGPEGEDVLKKLADDERNINYKNLFFKLGNSAIANYDFFKRFGTLHDLLIDLLNEKISLKKAAIEQNEIIENIEELRSVILLEEEKINKEKNKVAIKKEKTKTRKKGNILSQKRVIISALRLFDKRGVIIDAFRDGRFRKRCFSNGKTRI